MSWFLESRFEKFVVRNRLSTPSPGIRIGLDLTALKILNVATEHHALKEVVSISDSELKTFAFPIFLMIQFRISYIQIHLTVKQISELKSNLAFFTPQYRVWSLMHIWRTMGVRQASRSLGIKLLVMWTVTWSSYCLLIQLCRSKLCPQTPQELSLNIWHLAASTRPRSTPGVVTSATRSMWLPQQV